MDFDAIANINYFVLGCLAIEDLVISSFDCITESKHKRCYHDIYHEITKRQRDPNRNNS